MAMAAHVPDPYIGMVAGGVAGAMRVRAIKNRAATPV
jgi:hypothetical protein